MNAQRIMRQGKGLVSCRPDDQLDTALARMKAAGLASLPVADGDGFLVGVVPRSAAQSALSRDGGQVAAAMTRKVFCCRVQDTLSNVEASLRQQHLDSIPVIDDTGTLCGVVCLSDLPWALPRSPIPASLEFPESSPVGA